MIAAIVVGALIILWGLSMILQTTYGIEIPFWPVILIVVGILIVAGALYRRRRH